MLKKRGEWLTCTERSRKCIKYRKSTNEACLKSSTWVVSNKKRKRYDFEFVTLALLISFLWLRFGSIQVAGFESCLSRSSLILVYLCNRPNSELRMPVVVRF